MINSQVKTTIFLKKEYLNIKPSVVYILRSQHVEIVHKLCLTKDMIRLFEDANISIEEKIIDRDVNSNDIQIGDITVKRTVPNELQYISDNEDEAIRKYNKLKARLPEYVPFNGHECKTLSDDECKRFKSQMKLTK